MMSPAEAQWAAWSLVVAAAGGGGSVGNQVAAGELRL